MLKEGEILPHLDIEREIEMVEQRSLDTLDLEAAAGQEPISEAATNKPDDEGGNSQIRDEVVRRLKRAAQREDAPKQ